MSGPNFLAKGNISPCRFVKVASADFGVTQCAAGTDKPIGVSQIGTRNAPGTAADDGFAAIDGEGLKVFTEGDECLLEAGSGGWTRGDYLKSDGSGKGVPLTLAEPGTAVNFMGAEALESVSAGEFGRVQIKCGPVAV